jgi:hypothetical protein
VVWENPSYGLFGIIVQTGLPANFTLPNVNVPSVTPPSETVVEIPSSLTIPAIPLDDQSQDPPLCSHGKPTLRRTVSKKDSPNIGRVFYVCSVEPRCNFFRWESDIQTYSKACVQPTLCSQDVRKETAEVNPELQLAAWVGVSQGSEQWHRLRACRVTASHRSVPIGRQT